MRRSPVVLYSVDHFCPGGRHAWYPSNLGGPLRKPLNQRLWSQYTFFELLRYYWLSLVSFFV